MANVFKSLFLLVLFSSVFVKAKASEVSSVSLQCVEVKCETFKKELNTKFRLSFPLLEKKRHESVDKKIALSSLRLVHDLVHISLIQLPKHLTRTLQNFLIERKLKNQSVNDSLFTKIVSKDRLDELKLILNFNT